jgi:GTP cyclohydrolase II
MTKSKGYSLHTGVNVADEGHYGTDFRTLKGAVKDAIFWKNFAQEQGYLTQNLHDQYATAEAVKSVLTEYANNMQPGDILLLTYSGHGSEMSHLKINAKEPMNQTWCLYDRQMLDDEIDECLSQFQEGVRIVVVSDSCHSGSVTRRDKIDLDDMLDKGLTVMAETRGFISRKASDTVKSYVAYHHKEKTYQQLLEKYRYWEEGKNIKASVKLFSACQDNQTTLDGPENGFFTAAFAKVLADPQYQAADAETLQQAVQGHYRYNTPNPMLSQYGGIISAFKLA